MSDKRPNPPQDPVVDELIDDEDQIDESTQTEDGLPAQPEKPGVRRSIVGLLALIVAVAMIVADRVSPPERSAGRPVAGTRPVDAGGLLACPFFHAGNGRAWLHLANAGSTSSKITVTTVRGGSSPLKFKTLTLKPGSVQTIPVEQSILSSQASAFVEFAGGEVFASRTAVFASGEHRGGVAAPCLRAGDRTLVAPSGATLNAETSLVLLNPSSSDAVADVSFLFEGDELAPEALKSIVVKARDRRVVRVGDFVFDQKTVASVLRVRTGVVAADAIVTSVRGVTLTPAVPPRERLAGVAAADAGDVIADVVAFGEANAVTDASVMTPQGQTAFTALAEDLEPSTPVSVMPLRERVPAAGVTISLRDGSPIAGALRWIVKLPTGKGDVAAGMLGVPARRLVAVTGEPAFAQGTRVLLANPSEADATITLRLLTPSGMAPPETIPEVTLAPGTTVSVPIGTIKGAFGIVIESSESIVGTLSSTIVGRSEVSSFSVTFQPVVRDPLVAVETDPRLGVPAPL